VFFQGKKSTMQSKTPPMGEKAAKLGDSAQFIRSVSLSSFSLFFLNDCKQEQLVFQPFLP
jgi:hypothetical protein